MARASMFEVALMHILIQVGINIGRFDQSVTGIAPALTHHTTPH